MKTLMGLSAVLVLGLGCSAGVLAQNAPAATGSQAPVRFLVVADRESPMSAASPGRVSKVYVQLGDSVAKGKTMVAFDCSDLDAKHDAADAEYKAAQLRYEAKAKLQGLQSAAALEVELTAADVNRTKGQLRIIDAQLAQCRFVAPFDGRVARVHVKEGQGVAAGAPVIDFVGTGTPKARLNVPSNWIVWLKPGAHLDATVDETGQRYQLTVTRLSGRVDAVSQTIEIEADFTGDTSRVLPGMSGRATPGKG
ncbi:efflux RND transporter periplasmic adaptor subunit [Luteibacter pinisoli]|uniref:Efflux RND transporter periplasmic adaptor subunit n=1 Tax=Luteibacter pinisoli TaxID=2589080 RepID=A0A4Y5Z6F7_9GAMM|nr:efflux RND transporter periplasmic adaptor subunit [Luteibacter pinisoli]QDE40881.1 efflux RND transporter periplasmic adaptor subunit [Luteibacter pinisoli]